MDKIIAMSKSSKTNFSMRIELKLVQFWTNRTRENVVIAWLSVFKKDEDVVATS